MTLCPYEVLACNEKTGEVVIAPPNDENVDKEKWFQSVTKNIRKENLRAKKKQKLIKQREKEKERFDEKAKHMATLPKHRSARRKSSLLPRLDENEYISVGLEEGARLRGFDLEEFYSASSREEFERQKQIQKKLAKEAQQLEKERGGKLHSIAEKLAEFDGRAKAHVDSML